MGNYEGPAGGIRGHQLRPTKQIKKCQKKVKTSSHGWRKLPAYKIKVKKRILEQDRQIFKFK